MQEDLKKVSPDNSENQNREIKFRAKCIETGNQYDISTVDKPRDNRGSHNFKGRQNNGGYYIRLTTGHPNSNSRGYVAEHRLIVEENIGRILLPSEIVHHIDGNKKNNDISNLEIITNQGKHASLHIQDKHRGYMGKIKSEDPKFDEVKYRLYNKITGVTEIYSLGRLINTTFRNSQFEYRGRFTGLKDKNGVEIYEYDILEFSQEESVISIRRDITGANRQFDVLNLQFDDGHGRGNRDFTMGIAKQCIIIGNIYQNTELLSEK